MGKKKRKIQQNTPLYQFHQFLHSQNAYEFPLHPQKARWPRESILGAKVGPFPNNSDNRTWLHEKRVDFFSSRIFPRCTELLTILPLELWISGAFYLALPLQGDLTVPCSEWVAMRGLRKTEVSPSPAPPQPPGSCCLNFDYFPQIKISAYNPHPPDLRLAGSFMADQVVHWPGFWLAGCLHRLLIRQGGGGGGDRLWAARSCLLSCARACTLLLQIT